MVTKQKKYSSPPTYKQLNAILDKGWKLVSIEESARCYLLTFEKCMDNEEYYCLQRFIFYTFWSEEQYQQVMGEIKEYKERGGQILSTVHMKQEDLVFDKQAAPSVVSVFPTEGQDVVYYIIMPKESVNEQDKSSSYDEMLKYLAFRCYSNGLHGLILLSLFIPYIFLISLVGFTDIGCLNVITFLYILLIVCFFVKDSYYFIRYRLYRKREYSLKHFLKALKQKKI